MTFDAQPVLTGERVALRPLAAGDRDALYAAASDPLIWEQHPVPDRWREPVFRTFFDEALASGGALLALDRGDGRAIGSSRYFGYDAERRDVEIGWTFLARSHWGGAYNGEMKRLMLRHAFRFADSVLFIVGPHNLRSQRAVAKLGAVLEGRTHRFGRESLVFRLRSGDWPG
ncbi:MAG: N-acetyltransferase [Sphingomonadales bacterium]|jgi:RimJ/RimL family protein N-acetyltransferase|nr:N-acetyltransferase [Sphingomonadales bacterium]